MRANLDVPVLARVMYDLVWVRGLAKPGQLGDQILKCANLVVAE